MFEEYEFDQSFIDAVQAAKWLRDLDQMATDLLAGLKDLFEGYELYEDTLPDGCVVKKVKIGSRNNDECPYELNALCNALRLVNIHRPEIPFPESVLRRTIDALTADPDEFFGAIFDYRYQVLILMSYCHLLRLLENPQELKDAELESDNKRKAMIRQIISENPEWVEGKKNLVLAELKRRETEQRKKRPGIRRNVGFKIIDEITSEEA